MTDVIFYEAFKEEAVVIKKYLPASMNARFTSKTIQEEGGSRPSAKIICVRTQSCIPLSWAKHISGVLTRSQGYDHLLEYRRLIGWKIPCGYLPSYCSRAVAEQAVLTAGVLLRKFKSQMKHLEAFDRDNLTGYECRGRNLLVVGVGQIGSEVVDIARGLKMNVRGADIRRRLKNVRYVPLKEGMRWADIVICAASLTPLTKGMLNYAVFKKTKPGVVFVNVGRGEISPTKDLYRLIQDGILGALGLDVYEEEGRFAEYLRGRFKKDSQTTKLLLKLQQKDNVIFTPHNAFNTVESVERKAKQSVDSVKQFLKKKSFPWPIPDK